MDKPTDLKFSRGVKHLKIFDTCREVKHQKIFDTCPGFLQNLDQGSDGALKTLFLKYREKVGMDELTDLKFCREVKH